MCVCPAQELIQLIVCVCVCVCLNLTSFHLKDIDLEGGGGGNGVNCPFLSTSTSFQYSLGLRVYTRPWSGHVYISKGQFKHFSSTFNDLTAFRNSYRKRFFL